MPIEDRLRELAAVIPEAFADGRVNWETLSEALGLDGRVQSALDTCTPRHLRAVQVSVLRDLSGAGVPPLWLPTGGGWRVDDTPTRNWTRR